MKKFIVSLCCVVLTLLLFGGAVLAAERSNYFVMKAGGYFPNSSDLGGFNNGFNGEVAYGRYFSPNLAAELALGYFATSGSGSGTFDGVTSAATADIYTIPLTLALKAIYPIDQWEIYAIGGAGAYFCNAKVNYSGGSPDNSATAFGGFLGAGFNYNMDRNWFLGVEGKYLWVKPEFTFFNVKDSVAIDGWTVTGNLGFRF
jgi:outer membrane protein W